jgi:hypothetical protein
MPTVQIHHPPKAPKPSHAPNGKLLAFGYSDIGTLDAAELICIDTTTLLTEVRKGQVKVPGANWVVRFTGITKKLRGIRLRLIFDTGAGGLKAYGLSVLVTLPAKDTVANIIYPPSGSSTNPTLISASQFITWGTVPGATTSGTANLSGWSFNVQPIEGEADGSWSFTFTNLSDNGTAQTKLDVDILGQTGTSLHLKLAAPGNVGAGGELEG